MTPPAPLRAWPRRLARSRDRSTLGFTLIEILVVLTILTVAVGFMARTIGAVGRLAPANRETARAVDAARAAAEELRSANFSDAFYLYNGLDTDDPGGVGTAPGQDFDALGLDARPADLDGLVGRYRFPVDGDELREDVDDPSLGMPRDLNGDGMIDALDHSGDYIVLPFAVELEWTGPGGDRAISVHGLWVAP